jgi:transposase-like protein
MAAKSEYSSFDELLQGEGEQDQFRAMVGVMVRQIMHEEVLRHLEAEPYERTSARKGHRNGYKKRTLNTRLGKLEFEVPQVRGVEPYRPMLFERWQRSERALLVACAEMYYLGISTRKVSQVLEEMGGFSLSAATVSKVACELDEKVEEFRSRRLDEQRWLYLLVDARYEKVRHAGKIVSRALLIVCGINDDGRREILTWRVGDSESEQTWSEVFGELRRRGVRGVELLVSDDHKGIEAAMRRQFPDARWQQCQTHFMRNALNKVSYRDHKELAKDLRTIFRPSDLRLAREVGREVGLKWEKRAPRVTKQIEERLEYSLTVAEFPAPLRRRLNTTNMLERLMREIKRRTRVVGIFPNVASCDRLVGAILMEQHEVWQCERARYFRMEEP